jgi:hypothetical protein
MAEYWGIKEINARMGWKHPTTPARQMKQNGFLMFMRRRGKHPRRVWYTNDQLISSWEIARCKADRDRLLEEEVKKDQMKP